MTVTALMLITLRSLPSPMAGLSRQDKNRVLALSDKGLAKVRTGIASPTKAGLDLLAKSERAK